MKLFNLSFLFGVIWSEDLAQSVAEADWTDSTFWTYFFLDREQLMAEWDEAYGSTNVMKMKMLFQQGLGGAKQRELDVDFYQLSFYSFNFNVIIIVKTWSETTYKWSALVL